MREPKERSEGMARILLAEDDDSLRVFLSRALNKAGHFVTACGRGDEALTSLREAVFDLLVTDIVMPELDGISLAKAAAVIAPEMKVMFITGFAAVALNPTSGIAPGQTVLSKPFHLRDLVRAIDAVLEESPAA